MRGIVASLLLTTSLLLAAGAAVDESAAPTETTLQAPAPAPSDFPDKVMNDSTKDWIARWSQFTAETHAAKAPVDLVMMGDSMTERFPTDLYVSADTHNRGIGGDKIGGWKYYGLIDRLDVSVCDLKPRTLTIMIGVNDIVFASTPRENMAVNYDRLLTEIKACAPDTRVVLLSILPVRTTNKTFNGEIVKFNGTIRGLAQKHGADYVDLHPLFKDEQGELKAELASDTVHLNREGYTVWSKALKDSLAAKAPEAAKQQP